MLTVAVTSAAAASAETCPPGADQSRTLDTLVLSAQNAATEAEGRAISNQMWAQWTQAPDSYAQELLDTGMERREVYDFDAAHNAFSALVAYCPAYAEGYNQRAFVNFLRGDYAAALPDLERAIDITPQHVAARTGLALTLMGLERNGEAALVLREALAMNPWLGERNLLPMLEAQEDAL